MAVHRITRELLQTFVPINSLTSDRLDYLLQPHAVETLEPGDVLFRAGDSDGRTVYLLSGEIEIIDASGGRRVLSAGDVASWHPVENIQPRVSTALARTRVNCIRIDSDRLDAVLSWDQAAGYLVMEVAAEVGGDNRKWIIRLLESNIFYNVPASNIRELFRRMKPVNVRSGDKVLQQGDRADCCFFIKEGAASVYVDGNKVAVIDEGRYFGEDGLLTEAPRNASVVMETDGELMRLEKHDFDELLKAPAVGVLTVAEARQKVREGAIWLDVRLPDEYDTGALPAAIRMPLQSLRSKIRLLDNSRLYITYCDTGRRSMAAAFLLRDAGFDVSVLEGGLHSLSAAEKERLLVGPGL